MTDPLLEAVRRYVTTHADPDGLAQTPISGLTTIRSTAPGGLVHAISRPLVCLVLQGRKQVAMGHQTFEFRAGDSLLIASEFMPVSLLTPIAANLHLSEGQVGHAIAVSQLFGLA